LIAASSLTRLGLSADWPTDRAPFMMSEAVSPAPLRFLSVISKHHSFAVSIGTAPGQAAESTAKASSTWTLLAGGSFLAMSPGILPIS